MSRDEGPLVAVVHKRGRFLTAVPIFEPGRQVTLDKGSARAAAVGKLVLVGRGKRGARVVRELGRPDVARDVLEGLMLDRGLRRAFPRRVQDEVEGLARSPAAPDRGRRDMTALPTFTIDPPTARDYDDAISARREGELIRLWIHIADVTCYLRPGTAVEGEAYRRATSVYVPGAVEPMLPEALSNEACSLVAGEDRLAVTVELVMDGTDVVSVAFHRSVIRSDVRLAYPDVDEIFAGSRRAGEPWGDALAAARAVAGALRGRRADRRALEVESSEPSFSFDSDGNVEGILYEEQTESHRLIEELMILANEQVAGYLTDRKLPALYRIHERPEPLAVKALMEKLASLDVPTPPLPKAMSPQQASELAAEASLLVSGHVQRTGRGRAAFTSLVLRSLKQAVYQPENLGHSGLASERYCHFTSPIRRYPDIVCHRSLLAGLGLDEVAPRRSELAEQGSWSSEREREAMKIERSADDVCRCFLLERRLFESGWEASEFDGEVVGLVGAGAFVRFGEDGFEGFLPARKLRGEWWSLNEEETALVGERSGRTLRLGDPVRVSVEQVEAARGRVNLVPCTAKD